MKVMIDIRNKINVEARKIREMRIFLTLCFFFFHVSWHLHFFDYFEKVSLIKNFIKFISLIFFYHDDIVDSFTNITAFRNHFSFCIFIILFKTSNHFSKSSQFFFIFSSSHEVFSSSQKTCKKTKTTTNMKVKIKYQRRETTIVSIHTWNFINT